MNLTEREQQIISTQYSGNTFDRKLSDGSILLRTATGGFMKITTKVMAGLVQRADHVHQDHQESNTAKVRNSMDEFAKEGFDARVTGHIKGQGEGNPLAHLKGNAMGRNMAGSPNEVLANQHAGLPSQREPSSGGLPSSAVRGKVNESNLPSDIEHRAGYRS